MMPIVTLAQLGMEYRPDVGPDTARRYSLWRTFTKSPDIRADPL